MRMHGKHLNSILRPLQLCVEVPHARRNTGGVPAWNDDSLESKSTKHEDGCGVRGICARKAAWKLEFCENMRGKAE